MSQNFQPIEPVPAAPLLLAAYKDLREIAMAVGFKATDPPIPTSAILQRIEAMSTGYKAAEVEVTEASAVLAGWGAPDIDGDEVKTIADQIQHLLSRWQTGVYETVCALAPHPGRIDGSGSDSGPLELSLAEIQQGMNQLIDGAAEAKQQHAQELAEVSQREAELQARVEALKSQQMPAGWPEPSEVDWKIRGVGGTYYARVNGVVQTTHEAATEDARWMVWAAHRRTGAQAEENGLALQVEQLQAKVSTLTETAVQFDAYRAMITEALGIPTTAAVRDICVRIGLLSAHQQRVKRAVDALSNLRINVSAPLGNVLQALIDVQR